MLAVDRTDLAIKDDGVMSTIGSGSEEPRCVPVRSIYDLIWAVGIGSGGSDWKLPLRPGTIAKEPLPFIINNPPSARVNSESRKSYKLNPVLLWFCVPSPEN